MIGIGALTVLGWIIVGGLVLVAVLSVIYFWRGRRPTEGEEHELTAAERPPDPPGWSPH